MGRVTGVRTIDERLNAKTVPETVMEGCGLVNVCAEELRTVNDINLTPAMAVGSRRQMSSAAGSVGIMAGTLSHQITVSDHHLPDS